MSNHTKDDEVTFIKENRIVRNPLKKQMLILVKIGMYGLVFGMVAGLSYAIVSPFVGNVLKSKAIQESVSIAMETSTISIVESTAVQTTAQTEPVEEIIDNAIKNYDYSVDTVKNLMQSLSELADRAEYSFVRVLALKNGTDWFNNEMQTFGSLSGVIIADTEHEIFILVPTGELETADSIKIAFYNQTQMNATLKESDEFCGLSILSVSKEQMDENTKESVQTIAFGNAYNLKRGDIVIGMGSPLGVTGSVTYGNISYVANNVGIVDGTMRLMYSDATSNIEKGSFFLNTDGELIGWASNLYSDGTSATMISGLSDFKLLIEKMSNAQKSAYIGIRGVDVTSAMREGGVPAGIYVSDVVHDSPAYTFGIQPGDIVVKVGNEELTSMSGYKKVLDTLVAEEEILLTLVRNVKNEYKELQINLTVGSR